MLLPAIRFKFNYWLLKNIGLIMLGAFYFLLGVLVSYIIYKFYH